MKHTKKPSNLRLVNGNQPSKSKNAAPIEKTENGYLLVGHLSHGGNPIESPSRAIIDAINEELTLHGNLDAVSRFGIYSAYSTFRDFIVNKEFVTKTLAADLADSDHFINACANPLCPWNTVQDLYLDEAMLVLNNNGLTAIRNNHPDDYKKQLFNYLTKLKDHQLAALCLLNGMFSVPVSIILLYLNNRLTADDISSTLTTHFQIDDEYSLHEQDRIISSIRTIDAFRLAMDSVNRDGTKTA